MKTLTRLRTVLRNEKGVFDLQSIMIGVIVSSIVASFALISVIGVTRMVAVDAGKTTLRVLSTGLETFYTQYDRYPVSLDELAADEFVPRNYATMDGICYVAQRTSTDTSTTGLVAADYPQHYQAAVYIDSTEDIFYTNPSIRTPTLEEGTDQHCF